MMWILRPRPSLSKLDIARRNVVRLPPYHKLGRRRVRLVKIKLLICKAIGHTFDICDPTLECHRCGCTAIEALLKTSITDKGNK